MRLVCRLKRPGLATPATREGKPFTRGQLTIEIYKDFQALLQ